MIGAWVRSQVRDRMLEAFEEALLLVDGEDRVVAWNRAAAGLVGWSVPEDHRFAPPSVVDEGELLEDGFRSAQITGDDGVVRAVQVCLRAVPDEGAQDAASQRRLVRLRTPRLAHEDARELELLRTAWVSAPDAMFFVDRAGRIRAANESASWRFEYTREEFLALTVHALDPSLTGAQWAACFQEVLRSRSCTRTSSFLTKSGRSLPVEVSLGFIEGADLVSLVPHGIEERVLAETRYAELVDHAPIGIFGSSSSGRIVSCNAALALMLGYTVEELRGAVDIYVDREHERTMARIAEWQGFVRDVELQLRKKDGSVIDVSLSARSLRGESGKLVGFSGFMLEVTEKKRAEAALRDSEARTRLILDTALDAILTMDDAFGITRFNLQAELMFGLSEADVLRCHFADVVLTESSRREHAETLAMLTQKAPQRRARFDGEAQRGGQTFPVEIAIASLGPVGYGFSAFVRDITDRRRAEVQLMLADRMVSLGTVAASVAHEINNPLSYVIGNASFLVDLMDRGAPLPPHAALRATFEDVLEGAERVRTIVHDLKAFSRVDDKPGGEANLGDVARSVLRLFTGQLSHRVKLEARLADTPPVVGSHARLQQVLTNLVSNALQAFSVDDPVHNLVRVHVARIGDDRVMATVEDNGAGIPDAVLPRIFDPFFTTKPVGTGTGLGLAICHGIVTSLGGTITIESTEGQGTVSRVVLPVAEVTQGGEARERPPSIIPRRRVLVVDDDVGITALVKRILSRTHEVIAEHDGVSALARIQGGEGFDVILCDLMMPGLSGREFAERLRELAPELVPRCGFITGGVFVEEVKSFVEQLPPTHLLEKPFLGPSLTRFIGVLLGNN